MNVFSPSLSKTTAIFTNQLTLASRKIILSVGILKCGRPGGPASGAHCGRDLKCQIMKKKDNVMT